MMTNLLRAGALALALLMPVAAFAQAASSIQAPSGYAPLQAPCVKQADGSCKPLSASDPLPTSPVGTTLTDRSVTSLSSAQAAGTATIIIANASRHVLVIVPPVDCVLTLTSGSTKGIPLIGGLPNTFSGVEAPTNSLYVSGLTAGQSLTILEG